PSTNDGVKGNSRAKPGQRANRTALQQIGDTGDEAGIGKDLAFNAAHEPFAAQVAKAGAEKKQASGRDRENSATERGPYEARPAKGQKRVAERAGAPGGRIEGHQAREPANRRVESPVGIGRFQKKITFRPTGIPDETGFTEVLRFVHRR